MSDTDVGPGGTLPLPYCDCVCGQLTAGVLTKQISGVSQPPAAPGDPSPDPYSSAVGDLATKTYPVDYNPESPGPYMASVIGTAETSSNDTDYETYSTVTTVESIQAPNPAISIKGIEFTLTSCQYILRINFPSPWIGSHVVKVHWREEYRQYDGTRTTVTKTTYHPTVTQPPQVTVSESASLTYVTREVILTPNAGDLSIDTPAYTLDASALAQGVGVNLVGPEEIGTWGAQASLQMRSLAASYQVFGFAPYTASDAASAAVRYAAETASTAYAATTSYTGSQAVAAVEQVADLASGGPLTLNSTFSSTPGGFDFGPYISVLYDSYFDPGTQPDLSGAQLLTATTAQWSNGLILTLSDPIPSSDLKQKVNGLVAGDLTTAGGATLGSQGDALVLAMRHLSTDGTTYTAKTSQYACNLILPYTADIVSSFTGSNLTQAAGTIEVQIDKLTTNLDDGTATDAPLSYAFNYDTATGVENFTSDWATQAVPGGNERISVSNPRVTTAAFARWASTPQVEVLES